MRRLALLLLLTVVAVGCAGQGQRDSAGLQPVVGDQDQPLPADPGESATAPSAGTVGTEVATEPAAAQPAAMSPVMDLQAMTVSGDAFRGGDFAGKDLMLWFWAPW
ncbi:MAG: hypothetical protein ACR2HR_17485 [Euzebya sp.]